MMNDLTKTTAETEFDLNAAVLDLHAAVDRFKAYVETHKAQNPQHWPQTMTEGEWFEQFMSFMTLGLDDKV